LLFCYHNKYPFNREQRYESFNDLFNNKYLTEIGEVKVVSSMAEIQEKYGYFLDNPEYHSDNAFIIKLNLPIKDARKYLNQHLYHGRTLLELFSTSIDKIILANELMQHYLNNDKIYKNFLEEESSDSSFLRLSNLMQNEPGKRNSLEKLKAVDNFTLPTQFNKEDDKSIPATTTIHIKTATAHGARSVALTVKRATDSLFQELQGLTPQLPFGTEIITESAVTHGEGSLAIVIPDTLGEEYFKQITSLIRDFLSHQNDVNGFIFGDTPTYDTKQFTERHLSSDKTQTFAKQIHLKCLEQGNNPRKLVTLSGPSGAGKTWLASQYYHEHAQTYRYRLWVHADDEKQLVDEFKRLAETFSRQLPNSQVKMLDNSREMAKQAKHFLENHPGWLMVLDNAPALNEIDDWLPKVGGTLLITTNNPDGDYNIDVGGMQLEEARQTLIYYAQLNEQQKISQFSDIDRLIGTLDYLPLALTHAGVVIAHDVRMKKNAGEYLNEFRNKKEKLLAHKRQPSGHKHPNIVITWKMVTEALVLKVETREEKLNIGLTLNFLGWLDGYRVPVKLINKLLLDKDMAAETLELFRSFSIISYLENNTLINFRHGLFYELIREALSSTFVQQKFMIMTKSLQSVTPLYRQNQEEYCESQELYKHFEKVHEIIKMLLEPDKNKTYILIYLNFLHAMALAYDIGKQFDKKVELLEKNIQLCKQHNLIFSADYATLLYSLAEAKQVLTQYGDIESRKLLKEACDILNALQAREKDPTKKAEIKAHFMEVLANLADDYAHGDNIDDKKKAKDILEKQVLPFHEKEKGKLSLEVAIDKNYLASVFDDNPSKQYALLREALDIMDKHLKIDMHNERRLNISIKLIYAMSNKGSHTSFEEDVQHVEKTQKAISAIYPNQEAVERVDLNLNIGIFYFRYHRFNEAVSYFELALKVMNQHKAIYHDNHPNLQKVRVFLEMAKKECDLKQKDPGNFKDNPIRRDNMKFAMHPAPMPYEYALLSAAIYSNGLPVKGKIETLFSPLSKDEQDCYNKLVDKGWNLMKFISLENAYIGGIWVNDKTKQVVIVHRGSKNTTSWITDIESVVKLKPGEFITSALDMMKDPMVLEYRQKGYRLSATGHSLGGFLAQICVYWAHRVEQTETYYPEMSAMVFDSPGAVDFMETIQSNLLREKGRIKLEQLNIHNFCAMPTIVSTFGTHTGTVWHLLSPANVRFAFANDHRMTNILPGFDAQTGQPKDFRQMVDWPQADYSAYQSLTSAIEHVAGETVKAPFQFLNWFYKGAKTRFGFNGHRDTWVDQLFKSKGEVNFYLEKTEKDNYRPALEKLEDDINQTLKGHYATLPSEKESMRRSDIHHFDLLMREFLIDHQLGKNLPTNLGWMDMARNHYGEEVINLLAYFKIEQQGSKQELVLTSDYPGSIFDFQAQLLNLLYDKELISFKNFMAEAVENNKKDIITLQQRLNGIEQQAPFAKELEKQIRELHQQIDKLNIIQNQLVRGTEALIPDSSTHKIGGTSKVLRFSMGSAIANAPGSLAIKILDNSPEKVQQRTDNALRILYALEKMKFDEIDARFEDAVANAEGSKALNIDKDTPADKIKMSIEETQKGQKFDH